MSKMIAQAVLASYKKANKTRRPKILAKFGYSDEASLLKAAEVSKVAKSASKVKKTAKSEVSDVKSTEMLDMVIAFDTTGSMSSYIRAVKEHVKELIPNLFKNTPNLKMKIVAFGDYCDMISKGHFGNAYQETILTNNENVLINFVTNAKSTSGGDSSEFYELVIKKIVEETEWRADAKKAVLLIGDYTPHYIGYSYKDFVVNNQIDWKKEAKKAAAKGIQFDTLTILDGTSDWYKELSRITGGVSLPFKSSNKTNAIIEGLTYARGSSDMFKTEYSTKIMATMDSELIGSLKVMSKLTDK